MPPFSLPWPLEPPLIVLTCAVDMESVEPEILVLATSTSEPLVEITPTLESTLLVTVTLGLELIALFVLVLLPTLGLDLPLLVWEVPLPPALISLMEIPPSLSMLLTFPLPNLSPEDLRSVW